MRPIVPGTSSVAWFKLAEFVMRGEKERALSIHRLLSHSLPNKALVAQLEGDLLASFNDTRALDSYKRAVELYSGGGNYMHIFSLYQDIIPLLINQQRVDEACLLIETSGCMREHMVVLYEVLVRSLLSQMPMTERARAERYIDRILDEYMNESDVCHGRRITSFLAALAALDEKSYDYACHKLTNE